ncbi:adenosylcobinamide amidohydrolase [Natronomonas sp. EA1]|uniref:adenosylcobinamide amidohydrolase n=1 Tax=Natronomonas sp. EA1 TaxID=3421655 RepID=UPI003EBA2FE8
MFDARVADGVCQVSGEARWLSTGWAGGFSDEAAAYNVSVPEGFDRTDLDAYLDERLARAGFDTPGPALLTGVDLQHLRGARSDSVVVYATAGVSNPAALPMEPSGAPETLAETPETGTVNVVLGTARALDDAALANLLSVVAEAKAATLLAETGVPGTTSDAVVVGSNQEGEPATFSGSATPVGAAARACVRDAVRASLQSRYAEREMPASVADAEYGTVTSRATEVFEP